MAARINFLDTLRSEVNRALYEKDFATAKTRFVRIFDFLKDAESSFELASGVAVKIQYALNFSKELGDREDFYKSTFSDVNRAIELMDITPGVDKPQEKITLYKDLKRNCKELKAHLENLAFPTTEIDQLINKCKTLKKNVKNQTTLPKHKTLKESVKKQPPSQQPHVKSPTAQESKSEIPAPTNDLESLKAEAIQACEKGDVPKAKALFESFFDLTKDFKRSSDLAERATWHICYASILLSEGCDEQIDFYNRAFSALNLAVEGMDTPNGPEELEEKIALCRKIEEDCEELKPYLQSQTQKINELLSKCETTREALYEVDANEKSDWRLLQQKADEAFKSADYNRAQVLFDKVMDLSKDIAHPSDLIDRIVFELESASSVANPKAYPYQYIIFCRRALSDLDQAITGINIHVHDEVEKESFYNRIKSGYDYFLEFLANSVYGRSKDEMKGLKKECEKGIQTLQKLTEKQSSPQVDDPEPAVNVSPGKTASTPIQRPGSLQGKNPPLPPPPPKPPVKKASPTGIEGPRPVLANSVEPKIDWDTFLKEIKQTQSFAEFHEKIRGMVQHNFIKNGPSAEIFKQMTEIFQEKFEGFKNENVDPLISDKETFLKVYQDLYKQARATNAPLNANPGYFAHEINRFINFINPPEEKAKEEPKEKDDLNAFLKSKLFRKFKSNTSKEPKFEWTEFLLEIEQTTSFKEFHEKVSFLLREKRINEKTPITVFEGMASIFTEKASDEYMEYGDQPDEIVQVYKTLCDRANQFKDIKLSKCVKKFTQAVNKFAETLQSSKTQPSAKAVAPKPLEAKTDAPKTVEIAAPSIEAQAAASKTESVAAGVFPKLATKSESSPEVHAPTPPSSELHVTAVKAKKAAAVIRNSPDPNPGAPSKASPKTPLATTPTAVPKPPARKGEGTKEPISLAPQPSPSIAPAPKLPVPEVNVVEKTAPPSPIPIASTQVSAPTPSEIVVQETALAVQKTTATSTSAPKPTARRVEASKESASLTPPPSIAPASKPAELKAEVVTETPPITPKSASPTQAPAPTSSELKVEVMTETPPITPKSASPTRAPASTSSELKAEVVKETAPATPKSAAPTEASAPTSSELKAEVVKETTPATPKPAAPTPAPAPIGTEKKVEKVEKKEPISTAPKIRIPSWVRKTSIFAGFLILAGLIWGIVRWFRRSNEKS